MCRRILSFFMAILMYLFPWMNIPEADIDETGWNTNYEYVFVHGLGGWGEYDAQNCVFPYWGTMGGDLMTYLNNRGFSCHAASVDPSGSAWDRACELYAQLTGTVTDYGKEHSERCNHSRYGEDFTGRALIGVFDSEHKINLLGHSFGGATVLTFAELMANGSEAEMSATTDGSISGLFTGGKRDYIYSIVTLAAPLNGTTAIQAADVIDVDPKATIAEKAVVKSIRSLGYRTNDDRIYTDCAGYDMWIDKAVSMCESWETLGNVYYFSYACCATKLNDDGTPDPNTDEIESFFAPAAARICAYTGVTEGGIVLDEKWQPNDGLVNTYSAMAPFNAPQKQYDADDISAGIWNIMPVVEGDHTYFMGGLTRTVNIRPVFTEILDMINSL